MSRRVDHDMTLVRVRCDRCGLEQRNRWAREGEEFGGCRGCGHGYATYAPPPAPRKRRR